jgi:hypothetical protein
MARWSQTHAEHVHIATISQQIPIAGIARITLHDGSTIEGVLRNVHIGNNAGHGGWKYRGELEIETKERTRWTIDYLDIKSASNAWTTALGDEYEKLGLISIQR